MPRNINQESSTASMRNHLPPAAQPLFGNTTKLEFDEPEDAFGEVEFAFTNGQYEEPKQEPEPPEGTAKRKRPLKLTPSQRERKRAIDREAQRSIRIKTKNYIAHLENLVKVMEHNDTTGPDGENKRTRELMNQLKQSQDEVRALRETMGSVQRQLGSVLGDSSAPNIDCSVQRQSSTSTSPPSAPDPQSTVSYSAQDLFPPTSQSAHMPTNQPRRKSSMVSAPSVPPQPEMLPLPLTKMPERPKSDPRQPRIEGQLFFYAEYHLNRVYAAGPSAFGDTSHDEDIVVRAVIEGWAAVQTQYTLDLAWEVVREIDQSIWVDCGIIERMAIIRFTRTKLLHQVNARIVAPFPPMPGFMVQEVQEIENEKRRADVIDHFIWPGFRNCITQQPQKYISNYFGDKFRHNLKFMWPFDISTAYMKDPMTELYTSTPEFMNRQWNARCWTMRRGFFDGSEELSSCIPRFDVPIQKALSLPQVDMRGVSRHQMGQVEEEEVEDDGLESIDAAAGIASDPTMGAAGWQSMSQAQSLPQYWNMIPVSATDMDSSFGGLHHVGAGYPM